MHAFTPGAPAIAPDPSSRSGIGGATVQFCKAPFRPSLRVRQALQAKRSLPTAAPGLCERCRGARNGSGTGTINWVHQETHISESHIPKSASARLLSSRNEGQIQTHRPAAAAPQVLLVSSKSVGEYVEAGTNHGRKVFKRRKTSTVGAPASVFIYYWDNRDGANFSGWWFGESVGGAQVWCRCAKADMMPPQTDWRIPWDGQINADLVVQPKRAVPSPVAKQLAKIEAKEELHEPGSTQAISRAEMDDRVQRATDLVVLAEIEATQALESATALLEGEVELEGVRSVVELLQAQLDALLGVHKPLAADVMHARRSAPDVVAALSGLTPRVRSVQASLAQELKRAKEIMVQKRQQGAEQRKVAADEEGRAGKEQQDSRTLEAALPKVMEAATLAEEMLEAVVSAARPLGGQVGEESGEIAKAALNETEGALKKAQVALKKAKALLGEKVVEAKKFAPGTRKVALSEYTVLQEKVIEIQKQLSPYMQVRKDYEQRAQTAQLLAELDSRLKDVEAEVEQVTAALAGEAQPSVELVKSADAAYPALVGRLSSMQKLLEQQLQTASPGGTLREELGRMRVRCKSCKERLDGLRERLRGDLDVIRLQSMLRTAMERAEAAEEALLNVTASEEPFLKGVDAMSPEEAAEALAGCRAATHEGEAKVGQARTFLQARASDLERFPEGMRASSAEELAQLQNRVEVVSQKLAAFRRETAQRESSSLLGEVVSLVAEAELRVQAAAQAGAPLAAASRAGGEASGGFGQMDVGKLAEATEKMLEAEKSAALACAQAQKVLASKQREAKEKQREVPHGFVAGVSELQERLSCAQAALAKQRKAALQGEKLWKVQLVLGQAEERMQQVEAKVEEAEVLTTPLGDERLPTEETTVAMEAAVASAQAALDEVAIAVQAAQSQQSKAQILAPGVHLDQLQTRVEDCQSKLEEMRGITSELRERVEFEAVLEEARAKLKRVQGLLAKTSEAEAPYTKGGEIEVSAAALVIRACDASSAAIQQSLGEARAFVATRSLETKRLSDAVANMGRHELDSMSGQLAEAAQRLAQFRRDTDGRRKVVFEQEALAKVSAAEASVQRTVLAAEQLAAGELAPQAASEACSSFGEAAESAVEAIESSRQFLVERMRDKRVQLDKAEVVKLSARLDAAQQDLTKAKDGASEHEQRIAAKLLLSQAAEVIPNLEAEIEKATEAAAPLADGGKGFIAASLSKMAVEALTEYLQKAKLSREEFFVRELRKDQSQDEVSAEAFGAFLLGRLPELCAGRLAFSAEQQESIFKQADVDKDGKLSKAEFLDMFRERYVCTRGITITDTFELEGSKTLDKLEVDDVVESSEEPSMQGALGLLRLKVKSLKDGTEGSSLFPRCRFLLRALMLVFVFRSTAVAAPVFGLQSGISY
ncbi:unnamed protein product [Polarella glacialis]|uniref:EF-hand domain-containing protein n=1 Tax=Polarella glacialis TaxID=89957 RepID=A0A813LKF0_POLGL|nr:unnamed protein product [Polarella glacialis]